MSDAIETLAEVPEKQIRLKVDKALKKQKTPEQRATKQRRNANRRRKMTVTELSAPRISSKLSNVSLRSHIADDVPSLVLTFRYQTSFMHKFLAERGERVMQVAERLAAAMRMLAQEPVLYNEFEGWKNNSLQQAKDSILTLTQQREALEQTLRKNQRDLSITTPDKFQAELVFTTSIGRQVIELLEDIDAELSKAQYLYLAGALNDLQVTEVNRQGLNIINSYIDRAFKMTSPGKRATGRFQSSALAEHLKLTKTAESVAEEISEDSVIEPAKKPEDEKIIKEEV